MIGGCARCSFVDLCGGLDGNELDFFGCHRAPAETCRKNAWTCPICNPLEYVRRLAEVRSRSADVGPVITPCCNLPPYVARIDHASILVDDKLDHDLPAQACLLGGVRIERRRLEPRAR